MFTSSFAIMAMIGNAVMIVILLSIALVLIAASGTLVDLNPNPIETRLYVGDASTAIQDPFALPAWRLFPMGASDS